MTGANNNNENRRPVAMKKKVSFSQSSFSFPVAMSCSDHDGYYHDSPISSIVLIPHLYEYTVDDIERIWYVSQDYHNFKANTNQIAKLGSKSNMNALLKDAFQNSTTSSSTFSLLKKKASSSSNNNVDPLMLWCQHAHTRRGIEQSINKDHAKDRQRTKKILIQSVLKRQSILKKVWNRKLAVARQQIHSGRKSNITLADVRVNNLIIERQLADVSSLYSKDAIVFAQRMGAADANALVFENKNNATTTSTNSSITKHQTHAMNEISQDFKSLHFTTNDDDHENIMFKHKSNSSSNNRFGVGIPSNLLRKKRYFTNAA